jgi:hypothetical protein
MEAFADSKTGLIAEVDCTTDGGKPLCDANGVRGYPTLKWGDPAGLEDYSGGRDFDDLKKFADDNLKPVCSPSNIDLCDADQKKEIEDFLKLGEAELEKKVAAEKEKLEKTEADFKSFIESLQNQYKEAMEDKEKKIADIKAGGLSLMQQCLTSLKKNKNDEL